MDRTTPSNAATSKPKRRWHQFSLRSLLIGIVVLSLPLGWLGWKVRQGHQQAAAVAEIEKAGGRVAYDYEFDSQGGGIYNAAIPGPAWLHAILGDDLFRNVCEVDFTSTPVTSADLLPLKSFTSLKWLLLRYTRMTDSDLEQLNEFSQIEGLWLDQTRVTDAGFGHLRGFSKLRVLSLRNTQVTDAGLVHLKDMTRLQELWLSRTGVTDAGMVHLRSLTQLEDLRLMGTNVTDAGLKHLNGLTKLRLVDLRDTQVTEGGVARLQKALPHCSIAFQ